MQKDDDDFNYLSAHTRPHQFFIFCAEETWLISTHPH